MPAYSTVNTFERGSLPCGMEEKTSPPLSELCTKKGELLLVPQFVAGSSDGNKIVAWKKTFVVDGLPKLRLNLQNTWNSGWRTMMRRLQLSFRG